MQDTKDRLITDLVNENANLRLIVMQDKYEIDDLKKLIEELQKKVGNDNG